MRKAHAENPPEIRHAGKPARTSGVVCPYLNEESLAFGAESVKASEGAVELCVFGGLETSIGSLVVVVLAGGELERAKVFLASGGGPPVGPVFCKVERE